MLLPPFQHARVLTGPTGSGKTALALRLAETSGAEIVSMDSMALYRGMDIGTAKPSREERQRVPHHLIDVLDPGESSSVAWWLEQARQAVADIEARGKQALFVGGTPLYLKALMRGLFQGPGADRETRARLETEAASLGSATLHRRLADIDPVSAAKLHPNDARRIVRALEVFELTGRPISAWQTQWRDGDRAGGQGETPAVLWLDLPRAELYDKINGRVVAMFERGLVEEVEALARTGLSREAQQALGYKEVLEHLAGRLSRDQAIAEIQARTRNFAKRQVTWFRHLPGCVPASIELTQTLWHFTMHTGCL